MSLPAVQRAVVVQAKGQIHLINSHPLPKLGANEILAKIKAVSLNPMDAKMIDFASAPGSSTGADFAGEVVQLSEEAQGKGFEIGSRISSTVHAGGSQLSNGAFQEYVVCRPELSWSPPKSLSWVDAAALNVPFLTAGYGLYHFLGIPVPWRPAGQAKQAPVLIWAGSTGVGINAIQIAHLAGVPIVTTASPRNFDFVKSLGADAVFDYNDPEVVMKIQEWAKQNGGLSRAFDCISDGESTWNVAKTVDEGASIIDINPRRPKPEGLANNVKHTAVSGWTPQDLSSPDSKLVQEMWKQLPGLLEQGKLRNVIPTEVGQGLENVPAGIDLYRQKKISAKKLVYTI